MRRLPSLRWHKASGQFVVSLARRDHYLGADRATAQAACDRLTAEWLARGRCPEPTVRPTASSGPTIAALVVRYLDYADRYYVKNGEPTDEPKSIPVGPAVNVQGAVFAPSMTLQFALTAAFQIVVV